MRLSALESKIFGKVCYGYQRDKRGIVETVPGEEEIVKKVFTLYLDGNSLGAIQQYLFENNIPLPSGKDKWSRDVLNKLLNNFKYTFGIIDCDIYAYAAMEEYRLMSNLYAEEVSQTIAYSMFKGSKVGADLGQDYKLETYFEGADGNFLHPNAIRYMLY